MSKSTQKNYPAFSGRHLCENAGLMTITAKRNEQHNVEKNFMA